MILTVTLNPAVDKTYSVSKLITGQVNRMETARQFPGGKGINVSRILQQFGVANTATGLLGGYTGRFITEELEKERIRSRFIVMEEETRSNMNIIDREGYVTEILEPGPVVSEAVLEAFILLYRDLCRQAELIVLSGSAACGIPKDIYRSLIEIAKETGSRVLLDSSGELLVEGVESLPFLVKPNQRELEYLFKEKLRYEDQLVEAASILQKKGIERVVVSLGKGGLVYVDGTVRLRARPPKIKVVNTVGCGDSVVASMAMSILEQHGPEEALRRAVAISAANATTLENGCVPMDIWEEFMERVEVERMEH